MSELADIQSKGKKRYLKDVHFDFEKAHVAYTIGGAASLKDEPILLKQKEQSLSEEELSILKELNESTDALAEVDKLKEEPEILKGNETDMSEINKLQEQLNQMKQELAIEKAVNKTAKYNFENGADVAKALANLEVAEQETILKAFDALLLAKDVEIEEAVNKALESKPTESEENPVVKALENEAGHAAEPKVEIDDQKEETLVQKALKKIVEKETK